MVGYTPAYVVSSPSPYHCYVFTSKDDVQIACCYDAASFDMSGLMEFYESVVGKLAGRSLR